jgi:hypothetical protein
VGVDTGSHMGMHYHAVTFTAAMDPENAPGIVVAVCVESLVLSNCMAEYNTMNTECHNQHNLDLV